MFQIIHKYSDQLDNDDAENNDDRVDGEDDPTVPLGTDISTAGSEPVVYVETNGSHKSYSDSSQVSHPNYYTTMPVYFRKRTPPQPVGLSSRVPLEVAHGINDSRHGAYSSLTNTSPLMREHVYMGMGTVGPTNSNDSFSFNKIFGQGSHLSTYSSQVKPTNRNGHVADAIEGYGSLINSNENLSLPQRQTFNTNNAMTKSGEVNHLTNIALKSSSV